MPRDERDAVSPGERRVSETLKVQGLFSLTGEGVEVLD